MSCMLQVPLSTQRRSLQVAWLTRLVRMPITDSCLPVLNPFRSFPLPVHVPSAGLSGPAFAMLVSIPRDSMARASLRDRLYWHRL